MIEDRRIAIEDSIRRGSEQFNLEYMERPQAIYAYIYAGLGPFTQSVSLATTLAVSAATRANALEVTPVHLLLGILMPPNSIAVRLLEARGIAASALKQEILISIGHPTNGWKGERTVSLQASLETERAVPLGASPELEALLHFLRAWRRQAGKVDLHTGHLLYYILQIYRTHETLPAWMRSPAIQHLTLEDLHKIEVEQ